jgi:hypothetical protein
MSLWVLLIIVFVTGGIGGVINALLSDNGFFAPRPESVGGVRILRPGWLINLLVGGIAACVAWGLFGPFAASYIAGGPRAAAAGAQAAGLTLSSLVGAFLVGTAGAHWLTSEVDKRLLRAAASEAASSQANAEVAKRVVMATPAEALRMVASK